MLEANAKMIVEERRGREKRREREKKGAKREYIEVPTQQHPRRQWRFPL